MIYKKIISRIPAISSLLLAGLFLPGDNKCCSSKEDKNSKGGASPTQKADDVQSHPSNSGSHTPDTGKPDNGSKTANSSENADNTGNSVTPGLKSAVNAFMMRLVSFASLDYLRDSKSSPYSATIQPTASQAENEKKLNTLCKSIYDKKAGAQSYPEDLERLAKDLEKLEGDKSIGNSVSAYIMALNEIPRLWTLLHAAYKDISQKATTISLSKQDLVNLINNTIDPLLKEVDEALDEEKAFSSFTAGKRPPILTGARLNRFLNGKSKDETTYPEVTQALDYEICPLLLKAMDTLPNVPSPLDSGFLSKRGIELSPLSATTPPAPTWLVDGADKGDPALPNVSAIAPFPKPSFIFKNDEKGSATTIGTVTVSSTSTGFTRAHNYNGAMEYEKLKASQLVFTIFRGTTKKDFLKLSVANSSTQSKPKVRLDSDNGAYLLWVDAASQQNPDKPNFAKALYEHIQNNTDLSAMFVIPNVDEIMGSIVRGVDTNGSAINTGANQPEPGTPAYQLIDNVIRLFSDAQTLPSNGNEQKAKITALAGQYAGSNQDVYQKFLKTDFTIEQRIALAIAHTIDEANFSLHKSTDAGSMKLFIENLRYKVNSYANKGILKIENGVPVSTPVTKELARFITEFENALMRKIKQTTVKFKDIESKAAGFKLSEVRKIFKRDCSSVKSIFSLDVPAIIQTPPEKSIDYPGLFSNMEFVLESQYPELDIVRKEYHEKKNPNTKAAASAGESDNKKGNDKNAGSNQGTGPKQG